MLERDEPRRQHDVRENVHRGAVHVVFYRQLRGGNEMLDRAAQNTVGECAEKYVKLPRAYEHYLKIRFKRGAFCTS